MFKKIVSQLSLSPSAVSQVAFYAKRLKQESVTRTFSAIAAVLIVGLQFATILAPPAPSNAASPGDIVYGGIVSRDDLLNKYDADPSLRAIYDYFGITRADIVNTQDVWINSTDHSLNSLGRVQHDASDIAVNVPGQTGVYNATTYWARYLYQFDTGANVQRGSNYEVLQGTRSRDGGYFAVMFRCGNLVFKTFPPQPTPPPTPTPTPTPKPSPSPTPTPTPKPTPTPAQPTIACVKLTGNLNTGQVPLTVTFTGTGTASGQTISEYQFDFGDSKTSNQPTSTVTHQYTTAGSFTARLKVKGSTGAVSPAIAACSYTISATTPPASFTKAKSALNLTQNIDATSAPAHAGDLIRYSLSTRNTGGTAETYVVVEHLEDVLEYADVTEANGGTLANGVMTWPSAIIKPGDTLVTTFTVKVKNPLPNTPQGISDKFSYDLRMDNVYGNTVRINLQPPLAKQVEGASTELPQTGAGTATVIILLISALTLFFYFRTRQLAAEIKYLRNDYHGGAM
ncbi:MAG TPA: PKD domain-containing protein [Candidatus Saccharimonadia bacterium]|nr:PKD domain-containing protein [Candidatus Saccharimonadia bacterium]